MLMQDTTNEIQSQLASANARATELIQVAESLFGPISSSWQYHGVIFQDHPPHLYYTPEKSSVQISLSFRSINDDLQRDFQLAHEVCHLLYPSVEPERPMEPKTIVINEGISTYFSVIVVNAFHGEEAAQDVLQILAEHSQKYFHAFQQVSALISNDHDAIKKIRAIQPMINNVSKADVRASGLELPEETINVLLETF